MTKKQPEKILSLKTGHFLEKKVYFTGPISQGDSPDDRGGFPVKGIK